MFWEKNESTMFNSYHSQKKSLSCSIFLFFYWEISNLSIFLKSSIVITGNPEIHSIQLSHISDAGHGWVQIFWFSKFLKHPIFFSSLKCYIMFIEYLRPLLVESSIIVQRIFKNMMNIYAWTLIIWWKKNFSFIL